jgi:hypothetical protein
MRKSLFLFLQLTLFRESAAQITQTVRGQVTDRESGTGIPGVIVRLKSSLGKVNGSTDANGHFKMSEVPVGRQTFLFHYTGYKPASATDVIVSSGKEVVLNVEMEENPVQMDELVVKGGSDTDIVASMESANKKTFSIEETERYPGARLDPARMAQNFAGVQGTNDTRNDLVIRGNSPAGVLWRLEDIDIPNPNHFAIAGSGGGPQSLLNNKYLANSEFYTGAFPANYGNALGGVFDLRMRNGNNEKHERTFQFGILGTELAAEGPISKKTGASYLATYRYSTLDLFKMANFSLGTSAVPAYQDFGLRLNFPTKKAGVFSVSAIGGYSNINIILSKDTGKSVNLYGSVDRDQYFKTSMGTGILSHVISLSRSTVMKTSVAYAMQTVASDHYLIVRKLEPSIPSDTLVHMLNYNFYENKATLAWYIKSKINSRNSVKGGFFAHRYDVNYFDQIKYFSLYSTLSPSDLRNRPFHLREDSKDNFFLIEPYLNYVHKFGNVLSVNCGIYSQYLSLNGHYSIEPRAQLRYQPAQRHLFSIAYGLHSQMQSPYIYYAIPDTLVSPGGVKSPNSSMQRVNKDLDFSKANHYVASYDYFATNFLRFKVELYYQELWNVPVYAVPSAVSLLNRGATFTKFMPFYQMKNTGTGHNYGIELTAEKLYHRHFFFLFSGSVFKSRYKGSNGKEFDTDFGANFMTNALAGLEYKVGKRKKDLLSFGAKFTFGGGKRYSAPNRAASDSIMDFVPSNDSVNVHQFPNYRRLDLRVSYRINGKHNGIEIALDLLNVLNTPNVLALNYAPDRSNPSAWPFTQVNQLGFLPLFYIRVDF